MKSWTRVWTEIAEVFDTPYDKRTEKQDGIASSGLCMAMGLMCNKYYLPQKLVLGKGDRFWWRCGKKGDTYRTFFAGLMAAMGNKGFTDFLKWCEEHPK